MSAMRVAALGGSIRLNKAGEALGWLNPNAISILFYSICCQDPSSFAPQDDFLDFLTQGLVPQPKRRCAEFQFFGCARALRVFGLESKLF